MDPKVRKAGDIITRAATGAEAQAKARELAGLMKGDQLTFRYGGKNVDITAVRERIKKAKEEQAKARDRAANRRDRKREMMRDRQTKGSAHDPSDTRRSVNSSYEPEGETTLSEGLKKSTLQSYIRKVSYRDPKTGRGAVKPGRGKGYTQAQLRLTPKNAQELGYDGPNIRRLASKVEDSYSPEGETTLSEFADRVINRVYEAIVFDTDRSGSGVKGKVTGKGKRERGEGATVKVRYSGGNAGKGYDAEARVKNLADNLKKARAKQKSGRGGLSVRKGDPVNMRNVRIQREN